MKKVFGIFFLIALYDVIIGMQIAAYMQQTTWLQPINDIYQIGYFLVIFLTLIIMYMAKWINEMDFTQITILLATYCEDTFFYIAALFSPWGYEVAGFIPEQGVRGWIGLVLNTVNITFTLKTIPLLVVNSIGISSVFVLEKLTRDR